MSKGYLIARVRVHDAAAYETYKRLAAEAIRLYGGRYLVRGGAVDLLEGDASAANRRVVVVEFESPAQARRFYESAEYRQARAAREGIAEMEMIVVEGLVPDGAND